MGKYVSRGFGFVPAPAFFRYRVPHVVFNEPEPPEVPEPVVEAPQPEQEPLPEIVSEPNMPYVRPQKEPRPTAVVDHRRDRLQRKRKKSRAARHARANNRRNH